MKHDVLNWANGIAGEKKPSKETLNHPGIINLASGLDVYKDTQEAYKRTYKNLGIDIINRVPLENAPPPLAPGETKMLDNGYGISYLGVYNTYARMRYPFQDPDDFFEAAERGLELEYTKLITPVPHPIDKADVESRMDAIGNIGLYYGMYYTTLFMWGVEYLGWEIFMTAASIDPQAFDELFLVPAAKKSLAQITELAEHDSPFVFVHDDLASAEGPMFRMDFYDKYIFPKYKTLWEPVKKAGKKLIFVADGNMGEFFEPLLASGIDGVMFENPATDFDAILKTFGDRFVIGGMENGIMTHGTPDEVAKMVTSIADRTNDIAGFALASPGGLNGNIPLENLEAYFDARSKLGFTPENWRGK